MFTDSKRQPRNPNLEQRDPLCEVECRLVHETDKAWLVYALDRAVKVWVAKSACELTDHSKESGSRTLTLKESLAIEKGLV